MLLLDEQGDPLRSQQDALDLISASTDTGDTTIVVPAGRLHPDFFDLSTGVAEEFGQTFVTHRKRLVILGDVSAYAEGSAAFAGWIHESNRGGHLWFVPTMAELRDRIDE